MKNKIQNCETREKKSELRDVNSESFIALLCKKGNKCYKKCNGFITGFVKNWFCFE